MKIWYNPLMHGRLMAPAGDYGDGGDGGGIMDDDLEDGDLDEDDDDDDLEDDDDDEEEEVNKRSRNKGEIPITGDAIAKIVAETVKASRAPEPQKQYTQEELDAILKRPKVTEKHLKTLFDPEVPEGDKIQVLQELLDGAARHATTAAGFGLNEIRESTQARFHQMEQMQRAQEMKSFLKATTHEFPAFKGKEAILTAAIDQLNKQGYKGESKAKAIKTVAKTAVAIARAYDPNFTAVRRGKTQPSFATGSSGGSSRDTRGHGGKKKASAWD